MNPSSPTKFTVHLFSSLLDFSLGSDFVLLSIYFSDFVCLGQNFVSPRVSVFLSTLPHCFDSQPSYHCQPLVKPAL